MDGWMERKKEDKREVSIKIKERNILAW